MGINKYSFKFTPKASEDIREIFEYISLHLFNDIAAVRLMNAVETSITRLVGFPFSGSEFEDEYLRAKGYRKLIVESYIIIYLVDDKNQEVVIMRILYGKRKYEDLLKK